MPTTKGRYTPGRSLADVRTAIIRKIRSLQRKGFPSGTQLVLDVLVDWIRKMDERAAKKRGGVVRPRRPLRRIAR